MNERQIKCDNKAETKLKRGRRGGKGKKVCAIENVKTTRVGGISSIVKGKGDQLWQ